jgi:hypothetical protein
MTLLTELIAYMPGRCKDFAPMELVRQLTMPSD